jgi:hypothetical protein
MFQDVASGEPRGEILAPVGEVPWGTTMAGSCWSAQGHVLLFAADRVFGDYVGLGFFTRDAPGSMRYKNVSIPRGPTPAIACDDEEVSFTSVVDHTVHHTVCSPELCRTTESPLEEDRSVEIAPLTTERVLVAWMEHERGASMLALKAGSVPDLRRTSVVRYRVESQLPDGDLWYLRDVYARDGVAVAILKGGAKTYAVRISGEGLVLPLRVEHAE